MARMQVIVLIRWLAVFCIFLLGHGTVFAIAPDKSGVSPSVISLPTGPGAIEGLGESYEIQMNTGSGRYSLPMIVPPGRAGFQPSLVIVYDSGQGNGKAGMGWRFSEMTVKRQSDKGLPAYGNAVKSTPDTYITGEGAELVRVQGSVTDDIQVYRLKNEGAFQRYIYFKLEDRWEVTDRSGVKYSLGARFDNAPVNARTIHPLNGQTYSWTIAAARDLNDNQLVYTYELVDLLPYVIKIQYSFQTEEADSGHEIVFAYEDRTDPVIDYRPGFRLLTSKRIAAVSTFTLGKLVRKYTLEYEQSSQLSQLVKFTQVGSDGISTLPPAEFQYSSAVPQSVSALQPVTGLGVASILLRGANPDNFQNSAEILDFNGDSLPDLYQSRNFSSPPDEYDVLYENRGNGEFQRVDLGIDDSLSLSIQSGDSFVKDINGDGFPDLVSRLGINPEDFVFKLNQGGKWSKANVPLSFPAGTDAESVFKSPDARSMDVNFDKQIDTIRSFYTVGPSGTGVAFAAYINVGNGDFEHIPQTTPDIIKGVAQTFSDAQGALTLADLDGDRMQDLVLLRDASNGGPRYWPASGYGTFDDSTSGYNFPLTDGPDFAGDQNQIRKLDLSDLDGDGLADLILVSGAQIRFWPNLGNGSFGDENSISLGYLFDPTKATYRLLDIDADGLLDVLFYVTSQSTPDYLPRGFSYYRLYADNAALKNDEIDNDADGLIDEVDEGNSHPNLLVSMTNGIGKTTSLFFESHVQQKLRDRDNGYEWLTNSPFPITVVSEQEINDGQNAYITEFTYKDIYYSGEEKEFRGFTIATQREVGDETIPDLISEFTYHTGIDNEALKGKVISIEARENNGEKYYQESFAWETRIQETGVFEDIRSVVFPFNSGKTKHLIEKGNGTPISLNWEYQFDGYGNMTSQLETGRLDGDWDDERLKSWTYSSAYPDNVEKWILDRLVVSTIADENAAVASSQRIYYDQSDSLGTISKGNKSKTEDWIRDDIWEVATRYEHDIYGNTVAIFDGLHGKEPGHYREIKFDNDLNIYPIEEKIFTGNPDIPHLVVSAMYDPGFGVIESSLDFNGNETLYKYDPFSRLIAIVRSGDSLLHPTTSYDYVLDFDIGEGKSINWVETRQREAVGGGTNDFREFFDGLGRKLMVRAEGESEGQIVVSHTLVYNSRQTKSKEYLPYFEIGTLDYTDPAFSTPYLQYFYDGLGRKTKVIQPDDSISETEHRPLEMISKDEEQTNISSPHFGASMRLVYDGLEGSETEGRLREVFEHVKLSDSGETAALTEWKTSYAWDVLDNFVSYIDSKGNRKNLIYDGRSRKIYSNDPDRGIKYFEYDAANNLISTIDAKNQLIRFNYDGINRISSEDYGGDGKNIEIQYFYDAGKSSLLKGSLWSSSSPENIGASILNGSATVESHDINLDGKVDVADAVAASLLTPNMPVMAENTLGKLVWVRDLSGEEHRSYDTRGRVNWLIKRIHDSKGVLRNYYTRKAYDSMDRLQQLVYPDQSTLDFNYNKRGLLESVSGVVGDISYTSQGQIAGYTLSNGIQRSTTYDERLRLSTLTSFRQSDGIYLQSYQYDYDSVSNLVSILDNRSVSDFASIGNSLGLSADDTGRLSNSLEFDYDSLYRLVQTSDPVGLDNLSLRYDRLGNMLSKTAVLDIQSSDQNFGLMSYGGLGGSTNRVGRNPGEPPGPHARTAVENIPGTANYDDNGNLIDGNGWQYSWDYEDRLASASDGNTTVQFIYDYKNARVVKREGSGEANESLYLNKYAEIRKDQLVKYAYMGNHRIASSRHDGAAFTVSSYYLKDHLNSTNLVLGDSGEVLEHTKYFPFGDVRLKYQADSNEHLRSYQFTDKETDKETGLQYFDQRYYTGQGVFVSVDAGLSDKYLESQLASPQHLNTYAYSFNRPLIYRDDDGDLGHIAIGALVGAGVNLGFYLFSSDEVTLRGALGTIASGAITGAVGAATLGMGTAYVIGANLGAGVVGEALNQTIKPGPYDGKDILISGVTNAIGGVVGGATVGKRINKLKTDLHINAKNAERSADMAMALSGIDDQVYKKGSSGEFIQKTMLKERDKFVQKSQDIYKQLGKETTKGVAAQSTIDHIASGTANQIILPMMDIAVDK